MNLIPKRIAALSLLLIPMYCVFAQQGRLTGSVHDERGDILPFAHVLLLKPQDSSLVKGVTSDKEGDFSMRALYPEITFLTSHF